MASYKFIESTGLIVADTADTQTEVEDEYKLLFGADLIIDPESPEGLFISAEVESRDGIARNNADLANQINPNFAEGIFLDAIFSLTGGQRLAGEKSTFSVDPTITGQAGTFIPEGSQAKTASGELFETTEDVTIDISGTDTVGFQSVEDGNIQVAIGELNIIVDAILGWETVNNTVAATPGKLEESDLAARIRRVEELAIQGQSVTEAVFSNVRNVDGVISLTFRQNVENTVEVIDGIIMQPHSVFVCVDGGLDSEVAAALLNSKSDGADWNGTTIVVVTDALSGQDYDVQFQRPDEIDVEAIVDVRVGTSVVDPIEAVKDSVLRYANGEIEGERGFVVGADVSAFELAGAVNVDNPELFVTQVRVGLFPGVPSTATLPIALDEIARILRANIAVNIV